MHTIFKASSISIHVAFAFSGPFNQNPFENTCVKWRANFQVCAYLSLWLFMPLTDICLQISYLPINLLWCYKSGMRDYLTIQINFKLMMCMLFALACANKRVQACPTCVFFQAVVFAFRFRYLRKLSSSVTIYFFCTSSAIVWTHSVSLFPCNGFRSIIVVDLPVTLGQFYFGLNWNTQYSSGNFDRLRLDSVHFFLSRLFT